jgi:hypothetical protein
MVPPRAARSALQRLEGALRVAHYQLENLMQRIDVAWALFSSVGRKALLNQ